MQSFALEINDRALSIARDGRVLSSERGVSLDSAADEALAVDLTRRLAEHHPEQDEHVWIASAALADARNLSRILDVARGAGLQVDGFVDAAAVAVAALAPEKNALVLEVGLHHAAVTAVESGIQARRRRVVISRAGGATDLQEGWLNLIGTAMVKQTRFDPLQNAATEQQLNVALPGMMRELTNAASTKASVTVGSERFDVELTRDQFTAAAQPVYREIQRLLHELRPAGASVAIIMPVPIAALPGLRDLLREFVGCELIAVVDGFAAAATSLLDLPQPQDEQTVRLLRRLPTHAQSRLRELATSELLGNERAAGPAASHVLFGGRAHALGNTLVVGRAPDAPQSITLPEGLAGVSRRHCTFVSEAGELTLVDHSHFGTFLNGERVAERARVHAGDRVRLGDPGVELSLISLG